MRTDILAKSGPDPEQRLDIGAVEGIGWRLPQDEMDLGKPQSDDGNTRDGFLCFSLKSSQPLPATPARLGSPHTLVFKLGLRADAASGYTLDSEQVELNISLQFLRLRLWVVPGVYRHTSEAVAYLDLLPANEPLPGQEVCLSIETPDGMALDCDGCTPHQETFDQNTRDRCGAGAARWRLRYSGITWANLQNAEFKLHAGLEDPPDPAWQAEKTIQVYQNLLACLNDMTDDTELARKINNPDREDLLPVLEMPSPDSLIPPHPWDTPENIEANLKRDLNWLKAWPHIVSSIPAPVRENMYGPVYNILNLLNPGAPFVCSKLRDSLIDWLERRRFKQTPESAQGIIGRLEKMNGLDFGHYSITPAHVWAGIFPAGVPDRLSEYRALDPWWYQQWQDEWRHPDRLWTQADEEHRGFLMRSANSLLAVAVAGRLPDLTIWGAFKAVKAWMDGASAEQIRAAFGKNAVEWASFVIVDSDNADADGKYLAGEGKDIGNWFRSLVEGQG